MVDFLKSLFLRNLEISQKIDIVLRTKDLVSAWEFVIARL